MLSPDEIQKAHRHFAVACHQQTWQFLTQTDRTETDNEMMIAAAYSSMYHWSFVGTGVNTQRAYWLNHRVYVTLGMSDSALHYAELCMNATEEFSELMETFDLAYSHEAMARALRMHNRTDEARNHLQQAYTIAETVTDAEDKQILMDDLRLDGLSALLEE